MNNEALTRGIEYCKLYYHTGAMATYSMIANVLEAMKEKPEEYSQCNEYEDIHHDNCTKHLKEPEEKCVYGTTTFASLRKKPDPIRKVDGLIKSEISGLICRMVSEWNRKISEEDLNRLSNEYTEKIIKRIND